MMPKRWGDTVQWIHENWDGPISSKELAQAQGTTPGAALQLLRRLRAWGYVRLDRFIQDGSPGRPSHSYLLTEKGAQRARWQKGQKEW
jgi:predicted ArsR family transcriptional regulator